MYGFLTSLMKEMVSPASFRILSLTPLAHVGRELFNKRVFTLFVWATLKDGSRVLTENSKKAYPPTLYEEILTVTRRPR